MDSLRLINRRAVSSFTAAMLLVGVGCSSSPERQSEASAPAPLADAQPATPICIEDSHIDAAASPAAPAPPGDPFDSLNIDALSTRSVWEERFPRLFQSESNETSGLGCMTSDDEPDSGFSAYELPDGTFLGQMFCVAGAYNFGYAYFLIGRSDEAYTWTRLSFPPCSSNSRSSRRDILYNPVFDEATGNLTSFIKGRGLGDCGTTSDFYYQQDSATFCMRHCSDKPSCDGRIDNWPETSTDETCRLDAAFDTGADDEAPDDIEGEGGGDDHAEHADEAHHGDGHHRFSDPSRYADRWNSDERIGWQKPDTLIGLMDIQEGMKIADLGTGTGFILPYLSEAVGVTGRLAAIDIEESMLRYVSSEVSARLIAPIELCLAAPDSAPLQDSAIDRLITINTWHHVHNRVEYARAMRGAFRAGGAFYIVDYTMEHPDGPPMEMRLTAEEVIVELDEAGYDAERVPADLARQYVVRATPR